MVKTILATILLWANLISIAQIRYEDEFPVSFVAALAYIDAHNEATIRLQKRNIDPALAWSIVFPELIRFDAIQNFLEVEALKTLYIQYGHEYADFSIGHFQMKPSFAEAIQKEWLREGLQPCPAIDTVETVSARKAIIERLNSDDGQLLYLMMFIRIMQNRLPHITNTKEKVLLFSTAYNSLFNADENTLHRLSQQKTFHISTILLSADKNYCYSDIALYYFENFSAIKQ